MPRTVLKLARHMAAQIWWSSLRCLPYRYTYTCVRVCVCVCVCVCVVLRPLDITESTGRAE